MNKIGQKTGDFGKVIALPFSQKSPSKTPFFISYKLFSLSRKLIKMCLGLI